MNKEIILIDDDELLCRELSYLLRDEGFHVDAYSDPVEGCENLLKDNYGLLLLDLKMAKMSGWEILKTAQANGIKTKIIIITGHPMFSASLGFESLNNSTDLDKLSSANLVLSKPFDTNLLLAKIKELLPG